MAKFCKYCGKQIEEGRICDCPESLENAARLVNKMEATAEVTKEVRDNSKKVFKSLGEYFNNPRESAKKAVEKGDNLFIISSGVIFILSIMLNFFTVFSRLSKNLNKFINASAKDWGLDFIEVRQYNLSQNNGKILLYSLLFGIVVLGVLLAITFVASKLRKSDWGSKDIASIAMINTIPLTFCLVIGGILQTFISYKYLVLIQLLYLIVYIVIAVFSYNIITEGFAKGIDVIIYSILMFLGLILIFAIFTTITGKIVGTYEIAGQTIDTYITMIKNEISSYTGDIGKDMLEDLVDEMLSDIIY